MLGQRVPMVDGVDRVTGRIDYVLNLRRPGMLHARILRSPHAHARVLRVDASRAIARPGVVAVITRDDIVDRPDVTSHFGWMLRDQPIVAIDRVRYVGDAVAAVAALDEETAAAALDDIEVDYEPLPPVLDLEAALAPDAPILHPGPRELISTRIDMVTRQPGFEGTNIVHRFTQVRGDADAGFAAADVIIEGEYETPAVAHVPFETHVCVAEWTGPRRLTVWDATQAPHWIATELAHVFGLDVADVRVIVPTLGSGYGGKICPSIEPIAALLARKARRPVRIALPRDETFLTHTKHASRTRVRTGVMRDGTLVAHEATCFYDGGAYAKDTPEKIFRGYASMGPYRVPNLRVTSTGVYTNHVPSSAFRGFGIPQMSWVHEQQLDLVAERLGIDPLDLRLRNVLLPGDRFSTGEVIEEDLHYPELLRGVAEAIGWGSEPRVRREGPLVHAKGLAVIIKGMSAFPASAVVRLNGDGSLNVSTSSVEMGQGALTALAQIAADEATVPVERVVVSTVDTAITPWDQMTAASRTSSFMGRAVRAAVVDVTSQLRTLAARMLEISPDDLEIANGTVRPKDAPEKALPFAAIVGANRLGNLLGRGSIVRTNVFDVETGQGTGSPQWHPCVCGVEVTVDEETGHVTVTKLRIGMYVGRMINPTQVELQVQGAAIFGLGQALFEALRWDEDGNPLNPNFGESFVPSFLDVPADIDQLILETPGTIDVHGLGETSLPSVAPAIANAVAAALGIRVRRQPITPEGVLRLVREREAAGGGPAARGAAAGADR